MSANSKIEWTDATWNPLRARNEDGKPGWYCEHVSEGCRNCYAEKINRRLGTGVDFKPGNRQYLYLSLDEMMLLAPLKWRKPRMIFVCSMTDLFGDWVKDEWIDKVFAVMALCPQHTFQMLTKRPERMRSYLTDHAAGGRHIWVAGQQIEMPSGREKAPTSWPLPNVWIGVSAERQEEADERIPLLLQTPAAVRFVSLEPLLGPITLWKVTDDLQWRGPGVVISGGMTVGTPDNPPEGYDDSYPGLDWVIVGGESGPGARSMDPHWVRGLRRQCETALVPFFFKQWGEWQPGDGDCVGQQFYRVGKKAAGRRLDGIEHNAIPQMTDDALNSRSPLVTQ